MKKYIKPSVETLHIDAMQMLALSAVDGEGNHKQLVNRKEVGGWQSEAWTSNDDELE